LDTSLLMGAMRGRLAAAVDAGPARARRWPALAWWCPTS